ncbi:MAG TPA: hypothetical protein VK833_03020 [Gillisia sp.]|nr:hypothetical protein [Gillisia sp.]
MIKQISSVQNPTVKRLLQLQEKSRTRKKEGVFIVEGVREIGLAIKGGFEIGEIYFCAELFDAEQISVFLNNLDKQPEIKEL